MPPADNLSGLAAPEVQRLAARMAQDAFTRIFRLTLDGDEAALQSAVVEIGARAGNWVRAAADDEARALYAPARVHWERVETVAESFGDLDR